MKKKVLIMTMQVAGLFGLAAASKSCAREAELPPPRQNFVNQAVMRAQRLFESEIGNSTLPDWSMAQTWEYEQDIVTEVPALLTLPIRYTALIEGDSVSYTTRVSHSRLRIIENSETGAISSFVITLLPDESYDGDLSLLSSYPEGSDYWGISVYSLPNGMPLMGYRYENGELKGSIPFAAAYEDQVGPNVWVTSGYNSGPTTRRQNVQMELADTSTIISFIDGKWYEFEISNDLLIGGGGGGDFHGGVIPYVTVRDYNGTPPSRPADLYHYGNPIWHTYESNQGGGNGGGNGGGSGGGVIILNPGDIAPDALDLFSNDNLSNEELSELERMISEIMLNRMGGALYSALNAGSNIFLSFDLGANKSGYNPVSGIKLSGYNSGSLLHEMFHAYQYSQNPSSYTGASANREVEAYLAEYRYLKNLSNPGWEQSYETGFKSNIATLDLFLSKKGTLINSSKLNDFEFRHISATVRIRNEYRDRGLGEISIDGGSSFSQNFQNLMNLSQSC